MEKINDTLTVTKPAGVGGGCFPPGGRWSGGAALFKAEAAAATRPAIGAGSGSDERSWAARFGRDWKYLAQRVSWLSLRWQAMADGSLVEQREERVFL